MLLRIANSKKFFLGDQTESDNDMDSTDRGRAVKPTQHAAHNIVREFAGTQFQFINVKYIIDVSRINKILDISTYIMVPSNGQNNVRQLNVIDERPLFSSQRASDPDKRNTISATSALKRFRKRKRRDIEETNESINEDHAQYSVYEFIGQTEK